MRGVLRMRNVSPPWLASRLVKAAVVGLLFSAAAACTALAEPGPTPSPTPGGVSLLPRPPHIETSTLDQLFGLAGPYLQTSGDLEGVSFKCTIVEGTFCWFGDRPQDGPVPSDLARKVVDQIGAKAIENANRNEVSVRCSRPLGGGLPLCEIDWGWGAGWEVLPLE